MYHFRRHSWHFSDSKHIVCAHNKCASLSSGRDILTSTWKKHINRENRMWWQREYASGVHSKTIWIIENCCLLDFTLSVRFLLLTRGPNSLALFQFKFWNFHSMVKSLKMKKKKHIQTQDDVAESEVRLQNKCDSWFSQCFSCAMHCDDNLSTPPLDNDWTPSRTEGQTRQIRMLSICRIPMEIFTILWNNTEKSIKITKRWWLSALVESGSGRTPNLI